MDAAVVDNQIAAAIALVFFGAQPVLRTSDNLPLSRIIQMFESYCDQYAIWIGDKKYSSRTVSVQQPPVRTG